MGSSDLLAFPCVSSGSGECYSECWLASAFDGGSLWRVESNGTIYDYHDVVCGVRPVVVLDSSVKFTPAANNINDTQTWNISM